MPEMVFVFRLSRGVLRSVIAGVLTVGIAFAPAFALGQGTQSGPKISAAERPADPKASALLKEVSTAYKALGSYADQGQFVMAMTIAGKQQKQILPMKLTFVRPNKMDLDAGPVRVVSDG